MKMNKLSNRRRVNEKRGKGRLPNKYKSGCYIIDAGDVFVVCDPHGTNIGEERTIDGCEGIIEDWEAKHPDKIKDDKTVKENTKITLTFGQLKRLIRESRKMIKESDGEDVFYVIKGLKTGKARSTIDFVGSPGGKEYEARLEIIPGEYEAVVKKGSHIHPTDVNSYIINIDSGYMFVERGTDEMEYNDDEVDAFLNDIENKTIDELTIRAHTSYDEGDPGEFRGQVWNSRGDWSDRVDLISFTSDDLVAEIK